MSTQTLQVNTNGETKVNGVTLPPVQTKVETVEVVKVNPFTEVLSKSMQEACRVLKFSTRETEDLVTAAIRNSLRASLKREADKLFSYTGRRRVELRGDGLSLEKIEEKMAEYETEIKKFESLYRQLEK